MSDDQKKLSELTVAEFKELTDFEVRKAEADAELSDVKTQITEYQALSSKMRKELADMKMLQATTPFKVRSMEEFDRTVRKCATDALESGVPTIVVMLALSDEK